MCGYCPGLGTFIEGEDKIKILPARKRGEGDRRAAVVEGKWHDLRGFPSTSLRLVPLPIFRWGGLMCPL
ncbi:hypothetical protein TomTYG45_01020 [Sphingobium sp. TomTYG45]